MNTEQMSKPSATTEVSKLSMEELAVIGMPSGTFADTTDIVIRIRNGKPIAANAGGQGGGRTKIQCTVASEPTATQSSFLERQILRRDLNALAVRVTDPELVDSRDVYHQAGVAIAHARRRLFAMDRATPISGSLGHLFGPSHLVMQDRNDEVLSLVTPAGEALEGSDSHNSSQLCVGFLPREQHTG